MGTSVNQSSPRKELGWQAVHATYRSESIPVEIVTREVWRAATNRQSESIAELIAQPIVARIGNLLSRSQNPAEISRQASIEMARTKSSSLAAEFARRAAMHAVTQPQPGDSYVKKVFAEATGYLVARDLPGFVGSGRVKDVSQSFEFMSSVMNQAADVVGRVEREVTFTPSSWRKQVEVYISALRSSSR